MTFTGMYVYPQDEDYEWVVQLDGAGEEGQHQHQPIEIKAEDVKQARRMAQSIIR
jgi:hypothetical protein